MVETNEIWEIEWLTPATKKFHTVMAATLARAIELANEVPL